MREASLEVVVVIVLNLVFLALARARLCCSLSGVHLVDLWQGRYFVSMNGKGKERWEETDLLRTSRVLRALVSSISQEARESKRDTTPIDSLQYQTHQ